MLYINDLPNVAKNTKVALFADDAKCFLNIGSLDDCQLLQNDLNALVDWSSTWELNIHPSKHGACRRISVTRKCNPFNFDYFMNYTRLSSVKSIKDLGIEISSKLDWNTHINNDVKKCNRKLDLIKHTVSFNAPVNVTKALYLALIRSDLEFGSCLWSGTSRHNVECLEGVQRRATKFIMHFPDLDYRERLCQFKNLILILKLTVLAHGFLHVAALCADVLGGDCEGSLFWSRGGMVLEVIRTSSSHALHWYLFVF